MKRAPDSHPLSITVSEADFQFVICLAKNSNPLFDLFQVHKLSKPPVLLTL